MTYKYNPYNRSFYPNLTTEAQVENTVAQWNANKIKDKNLPTTPPGFKQLLSYNSTSGEYEHVTSYTSINVLNFIPVAEHKFIVERTSTLDVSSYIQAAIDATAGRGGTVTFPDGTYMVGTALILKRKVSLKGISETATIKALPTFNYVNATFPIKSIIKTDLDNTFFLENISIKSLTIHGNNVAECGIEFTYGRFCTFTDLDIIGCTKYGFYSDSSVAGQASYELRFSNLWIWREQFASTTDSIGFYMNNTTDSYPSQIICIGYHTGFKSVGGGNHFIQCHCWARPINGQMRYGFWCMGKNDIYDMCYADTPAFGPTGEAYGFYVDALGVKIVNSYVYNFPVAGYGEDNTAFGIYCVQSSLCLFMGNSFVADSPTVRLKGDFGGNFRGALLYGNRSNQNVVTTFLDRLSKGFLLGSGGGNSSVDFFTKDTQHDVGGVPNGLFHDAYFAFNPYPSNIGGPADASASPLGIAWATIAFFNQTSTTGRVVFDIFDGASVPTPAGRFTTNIAHRLSGNGITPSFLGMTNNVGFGTQTPGSNKVQVTGSLVVNSTSSAVASPGAGNIRTMGIVYGYGSISASRNVFSTDYYLNVDATTANVAVALQLANQSQPGRTLVATRVDGSANTVTITVPTGNTINGVASFILTERYKKYTIHTDGGTQWFIG